jgi:sterol 3beta-glucosyltransferase
MHITILALGSIGDVLPCAYLGQGLMEAGHDVRMVTFENFRPQVESHGLELVSIDGDFQALFSGKSGLDLGESGSNVFRSMRAILEMFERPVEDLLQKLVSPAVLDSDILINQLPGAMFGYDLAEKLDIPHLAAAVIPLVRTKEFPLPLFPQLSFGRSYNWLSHRLAEQLAWQPFHRKINRWRKNELGLPPLPLRGYFEQMRTKDIPVLGGFSANVVPRPKDWGEHVHVTGYWFPKDKRDGQLPENLMQFLDAGSPPVFVGFGSMPLRNPARTAEMVINAIKLSGQRGILSAGWGELGKQNLPSSIMQVGYIPYQCLFPRLAGVAIHGGSGTTAAALRAGVPTLVVPFLMDQFYWGRRVFELGAGPRPIPFKRLTTERLAEAIVCMVNDSVMGANAAALGENIRAEDGVGQAIKILDQYC